MNINIITQYNYVVLDRKTAHNLLCILPIMKGDAINDVQRITAGFVEELHNLTTDEEMTKEFKHLLINVFSQLQIGDMFYINVEWVMITPAKLLFARTFLRLLEKGEYYHEAKSRALRASKNLASAELDPDNTYVEALKEESFEEKFQRIISNCKKPALIA